MLTNSSSNWAALTYQKPPDPTPPGVNVFEHVELDLPGESWHNYKFESDAGGPDIPTHAIEVAKESARLSLIHLDTVIAWCGSMGKITSKRMLELYQRYLSWKHELSATLSDHSRDQNNGETFPFVLLLQSVSSLACTLDSLIRVTASISQWEYANYSTHFSKVESCQTKPKLKSQSSSSEMRVTV